MDTNFTFILCTFDDEEEKKKLCSTCLSMLLMMMRIFDEKEKAFHVKFLETCELSFTLDNFVSEFFIIFLILTQLSNIFVIDDRHVKLIKFFQESLFLKHNVHKS